MFTVANNNVRFTGNFLRKFNDLARQLTSVVITTEPRGEGGIFQNKINQKKKHQKNGVTTQYT